MLYLPFIPSLLAHLQIFGLYFLPVTFCLSLCIRSAGVGRTGTFITIDAMMERLNEKDDLNIYQFVTEMRSRRTFMVQTMVSGCNRKCKYP